MELGPDGLGILFLLQNRRAGAARGKQALVGHDKGALAVDGDGAALEDHVVGTIATAAGELSHLEGDLLVLVPRKVQAVDEAAVGVEVPVVGALLALAVDDVGGGGVAEPGVVGGHLDNGDVLVVLEDGLAVGIVDLVGAHIDRGELGDGAGDGGILLLSRLAPWAQVSVRWGQPIHTRSCGANSAGIKKPSALGVDSDSVIVRIRFPPNRTIVCRGRITRSLKPRDSGRPSPGKGRGARCRFSRSRTDERQRNQVRGDKRTKDTRERLGRAVVTGAIARTRPRK